MLSNSLFPNANRNHNAKINFQEFRDDIIAQLKYRIEFYY